MAECIKLPICLTVAAWIMRDRGGVGKLIRSEILGNPLETLKCAVPALCYTVQGNLLFTALRHLEAPTFQASRDRPQAVTVHRYRKPYRRQGRRPHPV